MERSQEELIRLGFSCGAWTVNQTHSKLWEKWRSFSFIHSQSIWFCSFGNRVGDQDSTLAACALMRDGDTSRERLDREGGKSLSHSSWLFILLLLPDKAYSFLPIPDSSWNKSWYCIIDDSWHTRTTAACWVTLEMLHPYRHKAKAHTCPRVFYLWLLSSGKVTAAEKLKGKGWQRLIRYPFKEKRAKGSSISTSHLISVLISFNIVNFFWCKCFIKD